MSDFFNVLKDIITVIPYTLGLALLILVLGSLLGSAIALLRIKKVRGFQLLIDLFLSYIRGIPILVHLFIAQAAFPRIGSWILSLFGQADIKVKVPSLLIVLFCYVLFEGAVESENIRGLFNAFDHRQYEAGLSIGLTPGQTLWRIVIPQLIYTAIPLFLNAFLKIVRTLSVAFLVGIIDIMATTRYAAALNSNYITSYFAASLVYWAICLLIQASLRHFARGPHYA